MYKFILALAIPLLCLYSLERLVPEAFSDAEEFKALESDEIQDQRLGCDPDYDCDSLEPYGHEDDNENT